MSEKEVQLNRQAEADLVAVSRWSVLYGIGAGVVSITVGKIVGDWDTNVRSIDGATYIDHKTLKDTIMLGFGLLLMGVSLMRQGQPFQRLRSKFQTLHDSQTSGIEK